MKNFKIPLLVTGLLALVIMACSRPDEVRLSGIVEDGAGQVLSLEKLDVNRTILVDSLKIKAGGRFSISFDLEDGELFILKNKEGQIINLLLSPGEDVVLEVASSSFSTAYTVSGSVESERICGLVEQMEETRRAMDSIQVLAAEIPDPESPKMVELRSAFSSIMVKQKRSTIRYLVEHLGDLSSVYALYQKYDEESMVLGLDNDLPYFSAVADSLEQNHPNSSLTASLRADIQTRETNIMQSRQLDRLLSMAEESQGYVDLHIENRDAEEISLSSLDGKVILVVFWSSASEASVSSLLELRTTYERYHSRGFEVYAVGLEAGKTKWMQAIDFNEFDWINVSELNFTDSEAALKYNVQTLPSSFLINREGDIMARDLWGRQLETWLDNLL